MEFVPWALQVLPWKDVKYFRTIFLQKHPRDFFLLFWKSYTCWGWDATYFPCILFFPEFGLNLYIGYLFINTTFTWSFLYWENIGYEMSVTCTSSFPTLKRIPCCWDNKRTVMTVVCKRGKFIEPVQSPSNVPLIARFKPENWVLLIPVKKFVLSAWLNMTSWVSICMPK